jgi:hypothetical protein
MQLSARPTMRPAAAGRVRPGRAGPMGAATAAPGLTDLAQKGQAGGRAAGPGRSGGGAGGGFPRPRRRPSGAPARPSGPLAVVVPRSRRHLRRGGATGPRRPHPARSAAAAAQRHPSQTRSVRVAAAANRPTWLPNVTPPKYLDGTLAGDNGFDPLGLGADPARLKWCVRCARGARGARGIRDGAPGTAAPGCPQPHQPRLQRRRGAAGIRRWAGGRPRAARLPCGPARARVYARVLRAPSHPLTGPLPPSTPTLSAPRPGTLRPRRPTAAGR